jgi:glyoxylate reductase
VLTILPGIQVSNAPHTTDNAVADQAIWLMIGALRRAHPTYVSLRAGKWRGGGGLSFGHDPEDKVIGIVGMGSIGRAIAKRAIAFGMHIIYHNRNPVSAEVEASLNAKFVDMDELLATSDVISLSLAYSPEAYHLIGKAEFAKMKKGVTIVNIARGKMIDEEALIEALDNGTVWSAGLDVFEQEPGGNAKLLKDDRVFLSPHVAAATIETYSKMEKASFDNIESVLTKGVLVSIVPDQKGQF